MQSTRNIGILTMNCQDCKTQEQRNRRHFFCGFIQNQFHLLKREQQTITTLYEIRYLFMLFTKIIIMMMMMNMLMMMIIIIRNITMSYQGWIKLENFTKIQGFFFFDICIIVICHLVTISYSTLFFSRQRKYAFVSRPALQCSRTDSNHDIMQCYFHKSLSCSESVCFAQLLLLFYLFIYCFFLLGSSFYV